MCAVCAYEVGDKSEHLLTWVCPVKLTILVLGVAVEWRVPRVAQLSHTDLHWWVVPVIQFPSTNRANNMLKFKNSPKKRALRSAQSSAWFRTLFAGCRRSLRASPTLAPARTPVLAVRCQGVQVSAASGALLVGVPWHSKRASWGHFQPAMATLVVPQQATNLISAMIPANIQGAVNPGQRQWSRLRFDRIALYAGKATPWLDH